MNKHKNTLLSSAFALSLLAGSSIAGTTPASKAPVVPPPAPTPFVTGTLSLTANTHFMSFGQDVWAAGNDFDDVLFNPSLELNFNLGSGFTGILGTWWDVNDNAPTSIGSSIQEIDVWAGFAYATGSWKTTFLYHDWMYASQHERAFELKLAYTHPINPYILLHYRFDDEIAFDTGLVALAGISPGTSLGPVALSFPVQVAFDTDGYHGGDAGFSFASAGISASIPIVEHVALNLGVTYYYTNDSVIPVNPEQHTLTASAGVTISF